MMARIPQALMAYLSAPLTIRAHDLDQQIKEELEFHLAERTREGTEQGLTESEARRAAEERFGDVPRISRECRGTAHSDLYLCHNLHLLTTAGLAAALLIMVWFEIREPDAAVTIDQSVVPRLKAALSEREQTPDPAPHSGDVSGQVVDEHGQPLEGAQVLVVVKTWPGGWYRQQPYSLVSDAAGRFRLEDVYDPSGQHAAFLAVLAPGRGLTSHYDLQESGNLEPVKIAVPAAGGLVVEFENADGAPVTDVEVQPHRRRDSLGGDHFVYFCSAGPVTEQSDVQGRVRLAYFNPGDKATLYVRFPQQDWEMREVVVPPPDEVVKLPILSDNSDQS